MIRVSINFYVISGKMEAAVESIIEPIDILIVLWLTENWAFETYCFIRQSLTIRGVVQLQGSEIRNKLNWLF